MTQSHLDILCHYHDDYVAESVVPLGSAGGYSGSKFWRVSGKRGTFCLRRWGAGYPTLERLQFIHAVLWQADQEGFQRIPLPVQTLEDMPYVASGGHFWELEPWIPGRADFRKCPSHERLVRAMTSLAEFHNSVRTFPASRSAGCSPTLRAHENQLLSWTDTRFRTLESRILQLTAPVEASEEDPYAQAMFIADLSDSASLFEDPTRRLGNLATLSFCVDSAYEKALQKLALRIARAARVVRRGVLAQIVRCSNYTLDFQPCILDIHAGHVHFEENRFAGFLDFGSMDMDNVGVDAARLLDSLTESDPLLWILGLVAYQSVRKLSDKELDTVQTCRKSFTLTTALRWLDFMFLRNEYPVRCSSYLLGRLDQIATQLES